MGAHLIIDCFDVGFLDKSLDPLELVGREVFEARNQRAPLPRAGADAFLQRSLQADWLLVLSKIRERLIGGSWKLLPLS